MTRTFDGRVCCPGCGRWHTQETSLERWIRNCEKLDSRSAGVVRFDCDILLHRYMVPKDGRGTRDLQCVMFIEAKTNGADVSASQRDTLSMFSQVLRNRRRNMHGPKNGRHAGDHTPICKCFSHVLNKHVRLWLFGGHLLQLQHDSPESSEWIRWDYKDIDESVLVQLLKFELDPDTLRPIDWRRRYRAFITERNQRRLWSDQ